MKYRKDITEYIWKVGLGYIGKYPKAFKAYLSNEGLIYMANYFTDNPNKISHYSGYSLYGVTAHIKLDAMKKFKVGFAEPDDRIVCRCGLNKRFSAFYGDYTLILKCEVCQNQFTAYSG